MPPILGSIIKRSIHLGDRIDLRMLKPAQLQKMTFRRLLEAASNTAFGRHYDFRDILMSSRPQEAFRQRVPLHDYDSMYEKWWHRALNNEEDVCWEGKVKYFALSSGTSTGSSKYIPVTDAMLTAMSRAGMKLFFSLSKYKLDSSLFTKEMLMIGGCSDLQDMGGYFAGDLSGINSSTPPMWIRRYYRPGTAIQQISDWNERLNVIAQNAGNWDVGYLTGTASWVQLTLERIIEYHNLKNIHELWPHLSVFVHGGIAFEPYRKSFERLLDHPLIYIDSYLASEGFVAFQNRPDSRSMAMLLHNGIYYEFVPFNSQNFDEDGRVKDNANAIPISEVRENTDYALAMSTCAGAWRYLIGDVVRFTDVARSEIIITGRTKQFLSITGEHLSIDNMNQAMQKVQEELNVAIPEFTVAGIKSGSHFSHKWYVCCKPTGDPAAIKKILDEQLCALNDDYRVERASMLGIELELIPEEVVYRWLEYKGKSFGQSKFARVMRQDQHEEWQRFLAEHTTLGADNLRFTRPQ